MSEQLAPGIGHNQPPPFEAFSIHIDGLLEEGRVWLDGAVKDEADAAGVSKLLDMFRAVKKDADAQRAAEKKPHDDAAKAVQAKWKPLLDRAETAINACKAALAPYLARKEAEQRAAADKLRREAEEKAAAARAAMQTADPGNLVACERAEALATIATKADKQARSAARERVQAAGGDRAVSLRTTHKPVLVNPREALRWYVTTNPDAIKNFLVRLAEQDVRAGARSIPGFEIAEVKAVA